MPDKEYVSAVGWFWMTLNAKSPHGVGWIRTLNAKAAAYVNMIAHLFNDVNTIMLIFEL